MPDYRDDGLSSDTTNFQQRRTRGSTYTRPAESRTEIRRDFRRICDPFTISARARSAVIVLRSCRCRP